MVPRGPSVSPQMSAKIKCCLGKKTAFSSNIGRDCANHFHGTCSGFSACSNKDGEQSKAVDLNLGFSSGKYFIIWKDRSDQC